MRYLAAGKWPAFAAAGLLAAAGLFVTYNATIGCNSRTPPLAEAAASLPALGGQNVSLTQIKSQVQHADETTFGSLVLKSDVPVLVDFYADWCGPCKRLVPVLEELAAEVPGVRIVKINVEDSPDLAAEYGISSIPSLKVFKKGQVVEETVGLASKNELRAMLGR
jgi:thioredoxin 1